MPSRFQFQCRKRHPDLPLRQPVPTSIPRSACAFIEDEFTPEATIDQHDFEAIFLEEFAFDANVAMEEAAPVERYMEPFVSHKNSDVTFVSGPGPSRIINRTSERIATTAEYGRHGKRKRPAKSSNESFICKYCGESFQSKNKLEMHYGDMHFVPDENINVPKKRAKR